MNRNPHLDGAQARIEAAQAIKLLQSFNESVERVSRKQIFLVKNKRKKPFYVAITSAPSNLKLLEAIAGVKKQYGKYELYIFFTRDVNTWPKSGYLYWNKVKGLYKMRGFGGAIMGLESYTTQVAKAMSSLTKVKMDYKQFVSMVNEKPDLLSVLKEIGLKGKKAQLAAELIELIK